MAEGPTTTDAPAAPIADAAGTATRDGSSRFAGLVQKYALVVAWLAVILVFGLLLPETFLNPNNLANILSTQAVLVILTVGLILPLTAGDIDLSVAASLGLSSVLVAVLNARVGWPIGAAIVAAIAAAALVGLVNALVSVYLKIDALIVTLGTSTIVAGLTLWISRGTTVAGIDRSLVDWTFRIRLGSISMQFYYAIVIALLVWFLFELTRIGRRLLIVGRGREVARLGGIDVARVRIIALTGAGALAGVAGVLFTGTSGSADPTAAGSFFLPAFAAAFLGATAIKPGFFNPIGTVVAAYFLATGINGLQLFGAPSYVQQLFYGTALIVAVALSQMSGRTSGLVTGT